MGIGPVTKRCLLAVLTTKLLGQFSGRGSAARAPCQAGGCSLGSSVLPRSIPGARSPRAHRPGTVPPPPRDRALRRIAGLASLLGFLGAGRRLPKAQRGRVCRAIHYHHPSVAPLLISNKKRPSMNSISRRTAAYFHSPRLIGCWRSSGTQATCTKK